MSISGYFPLRNVLAWAKKYDLDCLLLPMNPTEKPGVPYPLGLILITIIGQGHRVLACSAAVVAAFKAQLPMDTSWPKGRLENEQADSVLSVDVRTYEDALAVHHLCNFDAVPRPARNKGAHVQYTKAVDTLRSVSTQWRKGHGVWVAIDFESVNSKADGASDFGFDRIVWRHGQVETRDRALWVDQSVKWPTVASRPWHKHREDYSYGPTVRMSAGSYLSKLRSLVDDARRQSVPLFLIAHGANNDREWFSKKVMIEVPEAGLKGDPASVTLIDTQLLDAAFNLPESVAASGTTFSVRSLEETARQYVANIADLCFHNAGNDAYCTMRLFEGMMDRAQRLKLATV